MRRLLLATLIALLTATVIEASALEPLEADQPAVPATRLDELVLAALQAQGLQPAAPCSDAVFLRRVYLDMIGTLPTLREVQGFLADQRADKRAALIENLFQREEFADYWSLKWCDLLRVKSEFPINLWPNAVQAYHRWVRDALDQNMPYDQFARALLTSSGSNFRVPTVNFYRAVQDRKPPGLAAAVTLTFMGTRLDRWPPDQQAQLAVFFSRVAYKKTGEWKEEIVYCDPTAAEPLAVTFPDGTTARIPPDQDPRVVFTDWLLAPNNQWFARAITNRVWSWFLGRGIIHEPDDIRSDNPPSNPELLAYLQKELVNSHYDLRHLYRLILNSRTYQQSCVPRSQDQQAEALFAYYPVRRLDAEVLFDALAYLGGYGTEYSSIIPEPYTYVPRSRRTITLADGSISSRFLEVFGRPARDTGLESERNNQVTDAQKLFLLNSTDVQRRLEVSPVLRAVVAQARKDVNKAIILTYAAVLSRHPTDSELTAAQSYFTQANSPGTALQDLAWALINSKEFLYRH